MAYLHQKSQTQIVTYSNDYWTISVKKFNKEINWLKYIGYKII